MPNKAKQYVLNEIDKIKHENRFRNDGLIASVKDGAYGFLADYMQGYEQNQAKWNWDKYKEYRDGYPSDRWSYKFNQMRKDVGYEPSYHVEKMLNETSKGDGSVSDLLINNPITYVARNPQSFIPTLSHLLTQSAPRMLANVATLGYAGYTANQMGQHNEKLSEQGLTRDQIYGKQYTSEEIDKRLSEGKLGSAVSSALDLVGVGGIGASSVAKKAFGKKILYGALAEGTTEGLQEAVEELSYSHDTKENINQRKFVKDIVNSFGLGAIAGGGLAGGAGMVGGNGKNIGKALDAIAEIPLKHIPNAISKTKSSVSQAYKYAKSKILKENEIKEGKEKGSIFDPADKNEYDNEFVDSAEYENDLAAEALAIISRLLSEEQRAKLL